MWTATGPYQIDTGLPFFNHMLELFAKHSLFDLKVKATGDLAVDYHHTVEDVGLALGDALNQALGDRKGIERYGFSLMPMDETLSRVALDLGGRPYLVLEMANKTEEDPRFRAEPAGRVPAGVRDAGADEPAHPPALRDGCAPCARVGVQGHGAGDEGRLPPESAREGRAVEQGRSLRSSPAELCLGFGTDRTEIMIGVIDYGMGNLGSVTNALAFLQAPAQVLRGPGGNGRTAGR